MNSNVLVSPDLAISEARVEELEHPVTDWQFDWLEWRGLLDNGKTFEENWAENAGTVDLVIKHRNDEIARLMLMRASDHLFKGDSTKDSHPTASDSEAAAFLDRQRSARPL